MQNLVQGSYGGGGAGGDFPLLSGKAHRNEVSWFPAQTSPASFWQLSLAQVLWPHLGTLPAAYHYTDS